MTFSGFGSEASTFLRGLATNNSRDYFEAHRSEYVDAIRQPLEDLLGQAETVYGSGRVMRPNRDVRFSPDKTPYKTSASMWAGAGTGTGADTGAASGAGVYLSLSAGQLDVGGGVYSPSREQLERARGAIDSQPRAAARLTSVLDDLTAAGFDIAGPSLKTAPRGYDREHPHIDLLRLRHYAALRVLPVGASPDEIFSCWRAVEPLLAWCAEYAGAAPSRR